jgi:hypothetical protein
MFLASARLAVTPLWRRESVVLSTAYSVAVAEYLGFSSEAIAASASSIEPMVVEVYQISSWWWRGKNACLG